MCPFPSKSTGYEDVNKLRANSLLEKQGCPRRVISAATLENTWGVQKYDYQMLCYKQYGYVTGFLQRVVATNWIHYYLILQTGLLIVM
jgi:hypothetical protein